MRTPKYHFFCEAMYHSANGFPSGPFCPSTAASFAIESRRTQAEIV
ncbi:hypothetical protein ACFW93_48795 [Streptomyces canus]